MIKKLITTLILALTFRISSVLVIAAAFGLTLKQTVLIFIAIELYNIKWRIE